MEVRVRRSAGRAREYKKHTLLGWVFSLTVSALVLAFVFGVWLTPVRVSGASMAPQLRDGEIVFADRLAKYLTAPKRGDVVLFTDKNGDLLLKRIVALGGETVEIVGGDVYIDSCPLDERGYSVVGAGSFEPAAVPEDTVFVLGDDRTDLYDSRASGVGCVPMGDIVGVLRFRIYPVEKVTFYY